MKYWRLTWDQAMDDVSWQNAIMLNSVIPTYDDKKKGSSLSSSSGPMSFFEFGKQLSGL